MADEEHLDLTVSFGGASFTGAGSADRVMDALERFSELVKKFGDASPPDRSNGDDDADDGGGNEADTTDPTPPAADSPASKVPLPKFLEREAIKGNAKVATAIVVWAADHDQKRELTTREIEQYWKGTKLKVPGNTSRDIGDAVKAGWLLRDGRKLSASGYGREAIGLSAS